MSDRIAQISNHSDIGRHHIRYAILPHTGSVGQPTVRTAFEFNSPLEIHSHPEPSSIASLLSAFKVTGSDGIILDTIKRGEDDEDVSRGELPKRKGQSVILRMYDSLGGKCRGKLQWGPVPVKKAWKCNALEDDEEEMDIGKDSMDVELRAFEIATYRLQL